MDQPLRSSNVEAPEPPERSVVNGIIGSDGDAAGVVYERCRAGVPVATRRLRDATLRVCDLSNASCVDLVATRIELIDCRLVGLDVSGGVLRDVRATGCRLSMARAFGTRFERCWFEDCDLREADFDEALLDGVVFRGCDLRQSRFASSRLAQTDVRGSRVEGIVVDPARLAGAVIAPEQADVFAAALGLRVMPTDDAAG